jgi:hypothetical protein
MIMSSPEEECEVFSLQSALFRSYQVPYLAGKEPGCCFDSCNHRPWARILILSELISLSKGKQC